MRDLRILLVQTRYAIIATLRTSRAIVFGIVFPVFLLVLFNLIFARGSNQVTHIGHHLPIREVSYYTAGLAAYAVMLQTFSALAITIVTQRESGQLKRLRGTPMQPWTFIAAYVLRSIAFVIAIVIILFAVGAIGFGVHLHAAGILGLAVYVALGTFTFGTLGFAVTIICPTTDTASTVGPFSAVILSFISGVFIPLSDLPSWLQSVSKIFPLEHLADGIQRGLLEHSSASGLRLFDVAVLAAWGLVGLAIAAFGMRWEPQSTG